MVNFNQRLQQNIYVEWENSYLDYKKLKKQLKKWKPTTKKAPTEEASSLPVALTESTPILSNTGWSSEFFTILKSEMEKVNKCYLSRLSEYKSQFELLEFNPHTATRAEENSLQDTSVELYRLLSLLHNFALLNYTAVIKITKKHDKQSTLPLKPQVQTLLSTLEFAHPSESTLHALEQFYAKNWCDSNLSVARATLLVKKEDQVHWDEILIGIKAGVCLILGLWVIWDSVLSPIFSLKQSVNLISLVSSRAFPFYRGVGCLVLLIWLLGTSLYVWRSARINYRYIFEIEEVWDYTRVWSVATNVTILYLVNVLFYYKVINGGFPELIHQGYFPLSLFIAGIIWTLRTLDLKVIGQVTLAPFVTVSFLHTFVGDYLTSAVKILQDLVWSCCFFFSGEFLLREENDDNIGSCKSAGWYVHVAVPLCCALPLWWRFMQNIRRIRDTRSWMPHAANAFKYALAQVVSLFGVVHPVYNVTSYIDTYQTWWIVVFSFSSFYTWIWDVKMDWGLGNKKYGYLAQQRMYARVSLYYAAIMADLFLRFLWMTTLVPPNSEWFVNWLLPYAAPFTMVAELLRRTMWSFFRLENEHLRNTQGFRRVDFIPLHFDHGVGKKSSVTEQHNGASQKQILLGIALVVVTVVILSIAAVAK